MDPSSDLSPYGARRKIVLDFARWTALSALRRAPVRSREQVYPLLDAVAFAELLCDGPQISPSEFDDWHAGQTRELCGRNAGVPVGWAAKILNVYLKTSAYVGGLGRPGLCGVLHPPIDGGLWKGLRAEFRAEKQLLREVCCVRRIGAITDYEMYRRIICGCEGLANVAKCSLIELEQFWLSADTPTLDRRRATGPAGEFDI